MRTHTRTGTTHTNKHLWSELGAVDIVVPSVPMVMKLIY